MKKFDEILRRAEKRKGGSKALKKLLPKNVSRAKLAAMGDDRFHSFRLRNCHEIIELDGVELLVLGQGE